MAANLLGLAKSLKQLSQVPSLVSRDIAADFNGFLAAGFSAGEDPYGQGWAGLKAATIAKGRSNPPLDASGALKGSIRLVPMAGAGVMLASGLGPYYGMFHMSGTKHMAKRRYFPDSGLPARWRRSIKESFKQRVKERFVG